MNNKEIFSSNLRRYMQLNQTTRKKLSDDLGVSYYTITDWVNGKKYPRMDKVEMLAAYFNILISDLVEDKSEIQKNNDTQKDIVERSEISESRKALIDFAMSVPEDKADLILRVMKSILEDSWLFYQFVQVLNPK